MWVKLLSVTVTSIALSGCFSSSPKPAVIIVEKSINQQNIDQTRLASNAILSKKTNNILIKKKSSTKSWSIPVTGKVIKTFSKQHLGLTFDTKPGQTVHAIRDGIVVYSGDKMKSHGKMIIIKHPLGFYSSYIHNQSLKVADGDQVKKGQIIALTGESSFYFEMKKFKAPINPLKYLK
ncbi:MAG TPA: M23 family metallopeptidase [Piscirickettsiaceae bacterium]|jgi:lipoprotein NlpD|nr:M23 family metallopeptidase [Piscirickettsiaceae bacterium]